jgi:hypothetical protein
MRVSCILLLATGAASLELLSTNAVGTWSSTGSNSFENARPTYFRHAYKSTFLGKSTGGGLCASSSGHLQVDVVMKSNTDAGVNARGNYAGIAMRADSKTKGGGYECRLSSEHGDNGIMLTRNGKSLNNACHRVDQSRGVYNRYTSGYDSKSKFQKYDFKSLCQIQERVKKASLFKKDKKYVVRMEIEENSALNTATVSCFVDGKKMLYFTDPCPLTGGEFSLDAKYQSSFKVTDFTGTSCKDVPTKTTAAPSLADGLKLVGKGNTAGYWVSNNLAKSNSVMHRFNGGCNNGAYPYGKSYHPYAGGMNSEGGGRSGKNNVAALTSGKCLKDGFMQAEVSFLGDFLGGANGYKKVDKDGKMHHNQRPGYAGIAMRVDPKGTTVQQNYGYMCQMSSTNGKIGLYRGNNGDSSNRYNYIGGRYLTGRYRCKHCTCKSPAGCTQFQLQADGVLHHGAAHTLRLQITTDKDGHNNVQCRLNGTIVAEVVDKRSGRHKWFPTSSRSKGPGPKTNQCGDFGLITKDEDVIGFKVTDYTGYVKPTPAPTPVPGGIKCPIKCIPVGENNMRVVHKNHGGAAGFDHKKGLKHQCWRTSSTGCKCTCSMSSAPAPTPKAKEFTGSDIIGLGKDCCRKNGGYVGQIKNVDVAKCEAGCLANKKCNFFSHSNHYKSCSLCSKCDLISSPKKYNSYKMK